MGAFRYKAINTQGKLVKGSAEGDTERQVRMQLRQQQLKPVNVEKISADNFQKSAHQKTANGSQASGIHFFSSRVSSRISVKDLSLFTRQLASLVQSGMPLAESLQAVAKQTRKEKVKDITLHVRSRVLEGLSLAQALADYSKIFDSMYRAMVHAGEQAGFLGPVLERLSEYTETSYAVRQQLSSAMVYPLILVLVCIAIVVALMALVVPQLTSVFSRADQTLPWVTEWLISISAFLQSYGWLCLIVIVLCVVSFRWWINKKNNSRQWHRWLLKIPLLNQLLLQSDSTRFAITLSMLIASGVPLLNSLRISSQTMGNTILREKAEQVAVSVEEGASLHKALDKVDVFPPLMVQMAASGEANGTLAEQLDYTAKNQQRDLDIQLSTVLSIIEPVTIVFMGLVIGFIMYAIIIPITDMSDLV